MKASQKTVLPTAHGTFHIFCIEEATKEHAVLVAGEVAGKEAVPLRIHSECLTGDVFSSRKCDCKEQLDFSLKYIAGHGFGIIVYLRQEGRGIGLFNKMNAYFLQEGGRDTVEANLELGLEIDTRDYGIVSEILDMLGVRSISILTNNPKKIAQMGKCGIRITERIPIIIQPNHANEQYLLTKRKKLNHLI